MIAQHRPLENTCIMDYKRRKLEMESQLSKSQIIQVLDHNPTSKQVFSDISTGPNMLATTAKQAFSDARTNINNNITGSNVFANNSTPIYSEASTNINNNITRSN